MQVASNFSRLPFSSWPTPSSRPSPNTSPFSSSTTFPHQSYWSRRNFSSNDYLSLVTNAELKRMFMDRLAKQEFILGSHRAARRLGGNTPDHVRLEQGLATFFHGPSALLFSSGYDANVGLWSTLPQPNDVILYDESLHDGMRASKACHALFAFKHNCVEDRKLQDLVCTMPSVGDGRASVFVLVDALYSKDGDFAPLEDICSAVEDSLPEGSGYVFADEAHSTGVVGEHGRGVTVQLGLEARVLLRVHTFGKGFGCSGAHGFSMRHMVFPVVAVGRERVRLSTQAGNTLAEIDGLVDLIGRWLKMEKMKMTMAAEEDYNIVKGKL
ncbi:PLP-dependent transferase [Hymenopellis radicata]|nr:PLP-dependent transferase [Hymenopellis radicata]